MVTQSEQAYQVQGQKKKISTKHQLLCSVGTQRKTILLNMVSNQPFTSGEFNAYKKCCQDQNQANDGLPTRLQFNTLLDHLRQLESGSLEPDQVEALVRKRLETKIS